MAQAFRIMGKGTTDIKTQFEEVFGEIGEGYVV
jgi:hypothetical protein